MIKRTMDIANPSVAHLDGGIFQPFEKANGKVITKRKDGSTRVATYFDADSEPSKTQQQHIEECDVNNVVKKFSGTKRELEALLLSPVNTQNGVYGDFDSIPNYDEMLRTINAANESFEKLPSSIRGRFENDPQKMIDWLNDPANLDDSIKLGLRELKAPKTDPVVDAVNELTKEVRKQSKPAKKPAEE